jgi:hypothetical protein
MHFQKEILCGTDSINLGHTINLKKYFKYLADPYCSIINYENMMNKCF